METPLRPPGHHRHKARAPQTKLMAAQKVMLGGKRSIPTEICLTCCKSLWPTSFLVRTSLKEDGDASIIKLAHNLAAIGMDYCSHGLREHVLGQSHFKRIIANGGGFASTRQVTEFTWFLLLTLS